MKLFNEINGTEWADYLSTTMFAAMKSIKLASKINGKDLNKKGLYIEKRTYTAKELNIHPETLKALHRRRLVRITNDKVTLTRCGEIVLTEIKESIGGKV